MQIQTSAGGKCQSTAVTVVGKIWQLKTNSALVYRTELKSSNPMAEEIERTEKYGWVTVHASNGSSISH
jgi:hypothetical protein